jgi:hypothetical protein
MPSVLTLLVTVNCLVACFSSGNHYLISGGGPWATRYNSSGFFDNGVARVTSLEDGFTTRGRSAVGLPPFFVSFADEIVPIGNILASPASYQLRVLVLQGKARKIELVKPYGTKCGLVVDGFTFDLEDETGLIEVFVPGHCRQPPYKDFPVGEREVVVVEGQIEVQNVENPVHPSILVKARALWRPNDPPSRRNLP